MPGSRFRFNYLCLSYSVAAIAAKVLDHLPVFLLFPRQTPSLPDRNQVLPMMHI